MNAAAVTFDFHNTLADCPEWFELEVRRLPSAFLGWQAARGDQIHSEPMRTAADERYRALRREIMDHGNELTAEQSLRVVFDGMQIPASDSEIAEGIAALMREAAALAKPIPGAIETVLAVHASGTPLGVVSSAVYHPFLDWTLEAFGIASAFTTVVTSASAGFYKSRPEIYFHAAELLGAAPARMVHIGDSLRYDVGGASRAGMGTVWLQDPHKPGDGSDFVPDLTVQTLTDSSPAILDLLAARNAQADLA